MVVTKINAVKEEEETKWKQQESKTNKLLQWIRNILSKIASAIKNALKRFLNFLKSLMSLPHGNGSFCVPTKLHAD